MYSIIFYIGKPWKDKIYKNYPFFVLILLNIGASITMHYITPYTLETLGILPISNYVVSILLLISIAALTLGFVFNYIITEVINECKV
jgi:magnesium-transporting ATPase (P-type)